MRKNEGLTPRRARRTHLPKRLIIIDKDVATQRRYPKNTILATSQTKPRLWLDIFQQLSLSKGGNNVSLYLPDIV
jgi:hypothetical protein